jgi:hypothetical protein
VALGHLLIGHTAAFLTRLGIVRQVMLPINIATRFHPPRMICSAFAAFLVVVNQMPLAPNPLGAPDASRICNAYVAYIWADIGTFTRDQYAAQGGFS